MGQKVNPTGFRLGINRTWDSRWVADGKEYGKLLHEDMKIRAYLKERGVPIVYEGRRALGCHTSVEFLDPDGYHLELYYDMDQIPPGGRSRPRDSKRIESLEAARDNPKPPTW